MTQISLQIAEAVKHARTLAELAKLVPDIAGAEVRAGLERVIRVMQVYPPERPGQRYVRTYKLKRNFRIVQKSKSTLGIINRARFKGRAYAKYPIGDARGESQAWMHVGRWRVLRTEMEAELEKLPPKIRSRVHFFVRSKGFKAA